MSARLRLAVPRAICRLGSTPRICVRIGKQSEGSFPPHLAENEGDGVLSLQVRGGSAEAFSQNGGLIQSGCAINGTSGSSA